MIIESIRHKALAHLATTGKTKGLPGNLIERLRAMLTFLNGVATIEELLVPPNYGAHRLSGDRAGIWSLTVTRNWRMTFMIDELTQIIDLDLEDYH